MNVLSHINGPRSLQRVKIFSHETSFFFINSRDIQTITFHARQGRQVQEKVVRGHMTHGSLRVRTTLMCASRWLVDRHARQPLNARQGSKPSCLLASLSVLGVRDWLRQQNYYPSPLKWPEELREWSNSPNLGVVARPHWLQKTGIKKTRTGRGGGHEEEVNIWKLWQWW